MKLFKTSGGPSSLYGTMFFEPMGQNTGVLQVGVDGLYLEILNFHTDKPFALSSADVHRVLGVLVNEFTISDEGNFVLFQKGQTDIHCKKLTIKLEEYIRFGEGNDRRILMRMDEQYDKLGDNFAKQLAIASKFAFIQDTNMHNNAIAIKDNLLVATDNYKGYLAKVKNDFGHDVTLIPDTFKTFSKPTGILLDKQFIYLTNDKRNRFARIKLRDLPQPPLRQLVEKLMPDAVPTPVDLKAFKAALIDMRNLGADIVKLTPNKVESANAGFHVAKEIGLTYKQEFELGVKQPIFMGVENLLVFLAEGEFFVNYKNDRGEPIIISKNKQEHEMRIIMPMHAPVKK